MTGQSGRPPNASDELIALIRPDAENKSGTLFDDADAAEYTPPPVTITCKPGDSLDHIEDGSIDVVVMDPPYYANVMYAELSDFFYVWLKRTAGHVFPELFRRHLTDKDNEAVANPARFKGEKGASVLAGRDYQERMASIFAECRRTLKPSGIMTLMFTHKKVEAWDALTKGLMEAGFAITASWPIHTEAAGQPAHQEQGGGQNHHLSGLPPARQSDMRNRRKPLLGGCGAADRQRGADAGQGIPGSGHCRGRSVSCFLWSGA